MRPAPDGSQIYTKLMMHLQGMDNRQGCLVAWQASTVLVVIVVVVSPLVQELAVVVTVRVAEHAAAANTSTTIKLARSNFFIGQIHLFLK